VDIMHEKENQAHSQLKKKMSNEKEEKEEVSN
jgi:hypothetical protein